MFKTSPKLIKEGWILAILHHEAAITKKAFSRWATLPAVALKNVLMSVNLYTYSLLRLAYRGFVYNLAEMRKMRESIETALTYWWIKTTRKTLRAWHSLTFMPLSLSVTKKVESIMSFCSDNLTVINLLRFCTQLHKHFNHMQLSTPAVDDTVWVRITQKFFSKTTSKIISNWRTWAVEQKKLRLFHHRWSRHNAIKIWIEFTATNYKLRNRGDIVRTASQKNSAHRKFQHWKYATYRSLRLANLCNAFDKQIIRRAFFSWSADITTCQNVDAVVNLRLRNLLKRHLDSWVSSFILHRTYIAIKANRKRRFLHQVIRKMFGVLKYRAKRIRLFKNIRRTGLITRAFRVLANYRRYRRQKRRAIERAERAYMRHHLQRMNSRTLVLKRRGKVIVRSHRFYMLNTARKYFIFLHRRSTRNAWWRRSLFSAAQFLYRHLTRKVFASYRKHCVAAKAVRRKHRLATSFSALKTFAKDSKYYRKKLDYHAMRSRNDKLWRTFTLLKHWRSKSIFLRRCHDKITSSRRRKTLRKIWLNFRVPFLYTQLYAVTIASPSLEKLRRRVFAGWKTKVAKLKAARRFSNKKWKVIYGREVAEKFERWRWWVDWRKSVRARGQELAARTLDSTRGNVLDIWRSKLSYCQSLRERASLVSNARRRRILRNVLSSAVNLYNDHIKSNALYQRTVCGKLLSHWRTFTISRRHETLKIKSVVNSVNRLKLLHSINVLRENLFKQQRNKKNRDAAGSFHKSFMVKLALNRMKRNTAHLRSSRVVLSLANVHHWKYLGSTAIKRWVRHVEEESMNRKFALQIKHHKLSRALNVLKENRATSRHFSWVEKTTRSFYTNRSKQRAFRTLLSRSKAISKKRRLYSLALSHSHTVFLRKTFETFVSHVKKSIHERKINALAMATNRATVLRKIFSFWVHKTTKKIAKSLALATAFSHHRRRRLSFAIARLRSHYRARGRVRSLSITSFENLRRRVLSRTFKALFSNYQTTIRLTKLGVVFNTSKLLTLVIAAWRSYISRRQSLRTTILYTIAPQRTRSALILAMKVWLHWSLRYTRFQLFCADTVTKQVEKRTTQVTFNCIHQYTIRSKQIRTLLSKTRRALVSYVFCRGWLVFHAYKRVDRSRTSAVQLLLITRRKRSSVSSWKKVLCLSRLSNRILSQRSFNTQQSAFRSWWIAFNSARHLSKLVSNCRQTLLQEKNSHMRRALLRCKHRLLSKSFISLSQYALLQREWKRLSNLALIHYCLTLQRRTFENLKLYVSYCQKTTVARIFFARKELSNRVMRWRQYVLNCLQKKELFARASSYRSNRLMMHGFALWGEWRSSRLASSRLMSASSDHHFSTAATRALNLLRCHATRRRRVLAINNLAYTHYLQATKSKFFQLFVDRHRLYRHQIAEVERMAHEMNLNVFRSSFRIWLQYSQKTRQEKEIAKKVRKHSDENKLRDRIAIWNGLVIRNSRRRLAFSDVFSASYRLRVLRNSFQRFYLSTQRIQQCALIVVDAILRKNNQTLKSILNHLCSLVSLRRSQLVSAKSAHESCTKRRHFGFFRSYYLHRLQHHQKNSSAIRHFERASKEGAWKVFSRFLIRAKEAKVLARKGQESHRSRLLATGFAVFRKNYLSRRRSLLIFRYITTSTSRRKEHLLRTVFSAWVESTSLDQKIRRQLTYANVYHSHKILLKHFRPWSQFVEDKMRRRRSDQLRSESIRSLVNTRTKRKSLSIICQAYDYRMNYRIAETKDAISVQVS